MANKKISDFITITNIDGEDLLLIDHNNTTHNTKVSSLAGALQNVTVNSQAGTTYTLASNDAGCLLIFTNTGSITLSVPTNAVTSFPVGTQMMISQIGTGQVTVAAVTPGTTSINGNNGTRTAGQYAIISLIKIATDSWIIGGDATI